MSGHSIHKQFDGRNKSRDSNECNFLNRWLDTAFNFLIGRTFHSQIDQPSIFQTEIEEITSS
jgi:hypothetical protein